MTEPSDDEAANDDATGDPPQAARPLADSPFVGPGLVRLDAAVSGRVQGVGFRWFVLESATSRGIVGWVANAPDGSVRCVAEGARPSLAALLADLERGPFGARVDAVSVSWGTATGGFDRFAVRSGSHGGD